MALNMKNEKDSLSIYNQFKNDDGNLEIGRLLGRGGFGEVREIKYKNKTMAGKLLKKSNNGMLDEEKYGLELRGQNIIKINKIYTRKVEGIYYDLIIMEKALLRDLGKLNDFYHKFNLIKTLYNPFEEILGDVLLRFYSKQIINALEILDRQFCVHYDIKPGNLLVALNLVIKLSDFSILTKLKDGYENIKDSKTKIPGGTPGYVTPEYYQETTVSYEDAKKQDYFSLGATLFLLKYGMPLLDYKEYKEGNKIVNANNIIHLLQNDFSLIKSQHLSDKDFNEFLCSLIAYRPKERPSFEQIYRNKWLNKDIEYIDDTIYAFENDEEKIILELQKKDYYLKKNNLKKDKNMEKDILNNKEKELNDNLIEKENEKNNDKLNKKKCRFKFKKRKKE